MGAFFDVLQPAVVTPDGREFRALLPALLSGPRLAEAEAQLDAALAAGRDYDAAALTEVLLEVGQPRLAREGGGLLRCMGNRPLGALFW